MKRHHLKNWTEAEPNRLVARSKGRSGASRGEKQPSKDEARSVPASGPTSKSGSYTTLGRAPSTALNVPSASASQVTAKSKQERSVSGVSSCASGAEADTEKDTSIDESDEVGEISEALSFADCVNVGLPVGDDIEVTGKTREGTRSVSPATAKKSEKTGRNSPLERSGTPSSAVGVKTSSESLRTGADAVKASVSTPAIPQSVQGYDGGNVGVLGGGVKLGGGPSASASNSGTPASKHDQSGRSASGQSTARSVGQIRSTSGSSAFAATGSESETTIGSGAEGGKNSLSSGNKKRRGRPQQSRSPDVGHSRSRESISHPHSHPHHWSPLTPSRMHPSPTLGSVPSPKGSMGMGMLGGGIAGQPGAVGYPMAPGTTTAGYHQAFPGAQPWAQMPVGGLGMPMPVHAQLVTATPGVSSSFSNIGRLSPIATQTGSRAHAPPHLPLINGGIPGQPASIGIPVSQSDNATWRGYQHTMHTGPR